LVEYLLNALKKRYITRRLKKNPESPQIWPRFEFIPWNPEPQNVGAPSVLLGLKFLPAQFELIALEP
jgi:hypothetical protein